MRLIFLIHVFALLLASYSFAGIRTLHPKNDEIIQIRTSLGMATLVYPPSSLLPSIVGDQSAFRIDLFPSGLSIKPLRYNARTNLFIMTESRRFNLRLITVPNGNFDDVVYLRESTVLPTVRWKSFPKESVREDLKLSITKVGISPQGILLVEAFLTHKATARVKPENFWISQGKEHKTINSLYLSSVEAKKNKPLKILISFSKSDFDLKKPIVFEYRQRKSLSIQLMGSVWK